MDSRPKLERNISIKDFKDFYWLKEELVSFSRTLGLSSQGEKLDIYNRIIKYLETGEKINPKLLKKTYQLKALFPITRNTVIGIEYRTYKEKKEFFKNIIGNKFHFTVNLLNLFKNNIGEKTYDDLVIEWYKEQEIKKDQNYKKEIAPQFEYNTYIRNFFRNNPGKSRNEATKCWNLKKVLRGNNVYEDSDLDL